MTEAQRIAIVTGTSSGIGAATAALLVREGWSVVGLSRRRADLDDPRYRHLEADLADVERLAALAERELAPVLSGDRWRRVGLVNNAAEVGSSQPVEALNPAETAKLFAVNVVAPLFLMGFVARRAPAAAPLRIVNVSTGAALRPLPGAADYGSSKAALRLAGMTFAAELASDRRPGGPRRDASVLSYSPGIVDTAMQETVRSRNAPWTRIFVDFYEQGLLQPPEAPAREIVDFLAGDAPEPFLERRYGES